MEADTQQNAIQEELAPKEREEITVFLPKARLKETLGVDPVAFTATEQEEAFYRQQRKQRQIREKYSVTDLISQGGIGTVFKVQEQDLIDRALAMKVLSPDRKYQLKSIASLVKEAKITGFLEHPNIIPLHEFGLLRETGFFFTMKLVHGETLGDILTGLKRRKSEYLKTYHSYVLLNIFRKVCDAVSYAHSMGVLHLDIKPHNIIVGQYGEVFLTDWGAARVIGNPDGEEDPVKQRFWKEMTSTHEESFQQKDGIQGTVPFMSPEQAKGELYLLDERSDIFLLGATLYTMFALSFPYVGKSTLEVLQKAQRRKLTPPDKRNPIKQIPEEISRVIMKAMEARQDERYGSVAELAEEIDRLLAGKWVPYVTRQFKSGDKILQQGEAGNEAYLVLNGSVLVTRKMSDMNVVLGTYQAGEIIGEMSLLSKEPRSATIHALDKTTVAVLTKQMFSEHLKKLPPYIEKTLSTLTDRLQQTDTMIHPHITSDCTAVVLKYLRLLFKDRCGPNPEQFCLPLAGLLEEVSQDLGIPCEKIKNVVETAMYLELLDKQEKQLRIPNMDRMEQYIERSRPHNNDIQGSHN
ncbi:MAG: cyclic nucleotide-binding domain-containing protein [bacterium]|nr:cyclic nucleotide-binding domain-containing protein [bacterium]